eukprot:2169087-Prymnesium_polylepis.1
MASAAGGEGAPVAAAHRPSGVMESAPAEVVALVMKAAFPTRSHRRRTAAMDDSGGPCTTRFCRPPIADADRLFRRGR